MRTTMTYCPKCGGLIEFPNRRASQLPNIVHCPHCSAAKQMNETTTEFREPIAMYSVAVEDENEIKRLQKACPAARISDDPRDEMWGVPVAPTRQAKKQVLAATGYHEINGFGT